MPTTGSVYVLTDPRDGTIRYVGKTTKPLSERLAGHLASPTNPAMRLWISVLSAQRLVPTITLVSTVAEERLSTEEARQIKRHAKQGHRLFNAPYYHHHLTDLTKAQTVPAVAPPALAPDKPDPAREFQRKQYEPIVKQRQAGRMPTRRAACAVSGRAVFVALHMLWQVPLVRCLAYVGMTVWYLNFVGFGHLVQDQVLPRLPVAQAAAFWSEYLAEPFTTMAIQAAVVLYAWAITSYHELYASMAPPRPARRPARPERRVPDMTNPADAAAVTTALARDLAHGLAVDARRS